jgi:hypothetical protein
VGFRDDQLAQADFAAQRAFRVNHEQIV